MLNILLGDFLTWKLFECWFPCVLPIEIQVINSWTLLCNKHFNGHLICVCFSKFLKTKPKIYYWLNELNTELNDSKDNHNFDVIIQSDDTFKFLSKVSFHHTILSQIKVIFTWFYNKVIFGLKKQFIRAIKLLRFFLVNNFIDDWWHRSGLIWSQKSLMSKTINNFKVKFCHLKKIWNYFLERK